MVVYGHLSHSYGIWNHQSIAVGNCWHACSLKRMVMSSTEFSYAAAASEKCFKGGQHEKCIPTVYTHTHIYIYMYVYNTCTLYITISIYIHTLFIFLPPLSLYIYDAVVYTQQPNTVKGIGQRQMWHGLNAAILATESHIHLLAITLGQAIAQPRSGSGRESWNALKTAVLRWCLGTQRCT